MVDTSNPDSSLCLCCSGCCSGPGLLLRDKERGLLPPLQGLRLPTLNDAKASFPTFSIFLSLASPSVALISVPSQFSILFFAESRGKRCLPLGLGGERKSLCSLPFFLTCLGRFLDLGLTLSVTTDSKRIPDFISIGNTVFLAFCSGTTLTGMLGLFGDSAGNAGIGKEVGT